MMRGSALALVIVVVSGCTQRDGRCANDLECQLIGDAYHACDVERGRCICTDSRGCGPNEFCNARGDCQTVAGCSNNDDCGAGLFCSMLSGQCESQNVCGEDKRCCAADAECPFRQICDTLTLTCVDGCRDDADCPFPLGEGCVGAGFGRVGTCAVGCTNDALCPFGSLCNLSTGVCERDSRGPYCLGCSGGVQSDDCGAKGNYCLIDTVNGGSYCGVDCSGGQACPNGYECRDVIILPRSTLPLCPLPEACVDGRCARTGVGCVVDEDCPEGPPGSNCPDAHLGNCELDTTVRCTADAECPSLGACLKQECREREGAAVGVCSCIRDAQCPRDRCLNADPQENRPGFCELSAHPCYEDFECDIITCVRGGCRIGKNCKPSSDRTCRDVLE